MIMVKNKMVMVIKKVKNKIKYDQCIGYII